MQAALSSEVVSPVVLGATSRRFARASLVGRSKLRDDLTGRSIGSAAARPQGEAVAREMNRCVRSNRNVEFSKARKKQQALRKERPFDEGAGD
jgi:hypothetical protein